MSKLPNDCYYCRKAYGSEKQSNGVYCCRDCAKIYAKLVKRGHAVLSEWREFLQKHDIEIDRDKLHFTQEPVKIWMWIDDAMNDNPPKEVEMVKPKIYMPLPEKTEGGEATAVTS